MTLRVIVVKPEGALYIVAEDADSMSAALNVASCERELCRVSAHTELSQQGARKENPVACPGEVTLSFRMLWY